MKKRKQLSPTWFIKNPDFEHEKWILLDWLQSIDKEFKDWKLFPGIGELNYHYKNLETFLNTRDIQMHNLESIPKVDWDSVEALDDIMESDPRMQEMVAIAKHSVPLIKEKFEWGRALWRSIADNCRMGYIGKFPDNLKEGYIFLRVSNESFIHVFSYSILDTKSTIYDPGMDLHKLFIREYECKEDYDVIKHEVINTYPEIKDPLVLYVETDLAYPQDETLIPIIRQITRDKIAYDYDQITKTTL